MQTTTERIEGVGGQRAGRGGERFPRFARRLDVGLIASLVASFPASQAGTGGEQSRRRPRYEQRCPARCVTTHPAPAPHSAGREDAREKEFSANERYRRTRRFASSYSPDLRNLPEFGLTVAKPHIYSYLSRETASRPESRWAAAWLGTGIARDQCAGSVASLPLPYTRMHS